MKGGVHNIALWFIAVSPPYLSESGERARSVDEGEKGEKGETHPSASAETESSEDESERRKCKQIATSKCLVCAAIRG